MPTKRPRFTITETDEVARLIDLADRHWPEENGNRSRLIVRLILAGHERIKRELPDDARSSDANHPTATHDH